jgi:hypothetical protein
MDIVLDPGDFPAVRSQATDQQSADDEADERESR